MMEAVNKIKDDVFSDHGLSLLRLKKDKRQAELKIREFSSVD